MYRRAREVHVTPAQRQQLPHPQAGERGRQEQRCILLGASRANQRPHLLGREHLEVAGPGERRLFQVRNGVRRQRPHLARPLENAVHKHEGLRARTRRLSHGPLPRLDHRRRDRFQRHLAKVRQQLRAHDRPVAGDGRRLTPAVVFDVPQPLRGRVGECGTGTNQTRQGSAPGLVERGAQPLLGQPLREVPVRRTAALGPRRPDLLLHLAPVRQAVLRVPNRPALALDPEHMTSRDPAMTTGYADLGTDWGHASRSLLSPRPRNSRFAGTSRSRRPESNRGPLHYEARAPTGRCGSDMGIRKQDGDTQRAGRSPARR